MKHVVPALCTVAAVVFIALGGDQNGAWAVMFGTVALVIWLFIGFISLSARSTGDRHAEERAREEFARTGRWPHDPEADG